MSVYSTTLRATSPVAYWRLGETTGTVAVDEVGAYNGTYVGSPTLGVPGLLAGDANTAVRFTGNNGQGVTAPDAVADVANGTAAFSLAIWVKHTPDATYRRLFERAEGAGGTQGIRVFSQDSTTGGGRFDSGGAGDTIYGSVLTGASAHFVVMTYDGATLRFYIDGVANGTPVASTRSVPNLTTTLSIGSGQAASAVINGTIDEPAVWNRVLSAFEVAALYAATSVGNNAAWLNTFLATALRDVAYGTWTTGEMDNLITWSVARLWPRYSRPIQPGLATIALTAGTYYYNLPTGVIAVSRIDLLDSSGNDLGPIAGRAWELTGDNYSTTGQIHIAPVIAETSGTLKLHGYARYDVTSNLIPDDFVPLVLARARAEAYRRVLGDRARFKAWLSRNQTQNVSVNELVQEINEADAEAIRLKSELRVWMKPVPARQGY